MLLQVNVVQCKFLRFVYQCFINPYFKTNLSALKGTPPTCQIL